MAHKDPERRRAYWRESQQRRRARLREDRNGKLQIQLRETASAGMGGGPLVVTCRFPANSSHVRSDRPKETDWTSVRRVWVPEVPLVRMHDATERLLTPDRQVTMLVLVPTLAAPQDWPTLLAAAEAAGSIVLVQRWIRQRPAAVLGFRVDPATFSAAWRPWGVVLHGGVPRPVAVQHKPPPSPPRREPAPAAGSGSPWQASAPPDAEDAPTQERTVPFSEPDMHDDPVYEIHRRAYGCSIQSLSKEEGDRRYEDIDKRVYNLDVERISPERIVEIVTERIRRQLESRG